MPRRKSGLLYTTCLLVYRYITCDIGLPAAVTRLCCLSSLNIMMDHPNSNVVILLCDYVHSIIRGAITILCYSDKATTYNRRVTVTGRHRTTLSGC